MKTALFLLLPVLLSAQAPRELSIVTGRGELVTFERDIEQVAEELCGQFTGKIDDDCRGGQKWQVGEEYADRVAEQRKRRCKRLRGEIDFEIAFAKIAVHRFLGWHTTAFLYKDGSMRSLMVVLLPTAPSCDETEKK